MAPKLPPPPTGKAAPGGAASPGDSPDEFIGVPDGFSIPPTMGDWFRPERQVYAGGNLVGATPKLPLYAEGTEDALFGMSAENLARLQAQMAAVGLIGPETRFRVGMVTGTSDPTYTAFKKLLGTANRYGTTWDRALDLLADQPSALGGDVTVGKDGQPVVAGEATGPTKTRHTQIDEPVFTDPVTARAVVRDAMQSRLGRAPTADEYQQFRGLLSNTEAGQDVTTQVVTTKPNGNSRTKVTRSDDTTDPSAAAVADEFTRKGKIGREANTVQAASFMDIIASRVGL